jgi:hypothetical protein
MKELVIEHVVKYMTWCNLYFVTTLIPLHDILMVHFHPMVSILRGSRVMNHVGASVIY